MDRQKLVGWILVALATVFILYFLKARVLEPGPPIASKEWVQFIGSIVLLMIGTANVRLAAMRERRRNGLSNRH
jgi:hypothetical protein